MGCKSNSIVFGKKHLRDTLAGLPESQSRKEHRAQRLASIADKMSAAVPKDSRDMVALLKFEILLFSGFRV